MKIKLDYGKEGLWVEVPGENLTKILSMKKTASIKNPMEKVQQSLDSPIASPSLAQLAKGKKTAFL